MPRPSPLQNIASGRNVPSDYQSLTPRTPHSRAGLAEEALHEIELDTVGDGDYRSYRQQQAEPLLASSADGSFAPSGYRSRGDDYDMRASKPLFGGLTVAMVVNRMPLVIGVVLSFILLFLFVVSIRRPDVLDKYLGSSNGSATVEVLDTNPSSTAKPLPSAGTEQPHAPDLQIISYVNYTHFPLQATEYRNECHKLVHGFMSHGRYWDPPKPPQDVLHHDPNDVTLFEGELTKTCDSTITYMLDGHVGLLADLALLAQAAALARERNRTFLVDDTYWTRGKWTDHFQDVRTLQPGPEPGCRAPPPEELVACPRTARHWVINSQTVKYHFGDPFADKYHDAKAHYMNRVKPVFNHAVESFADTIRPNARNAALIRTARSEFASNFSSRYMGVHVRRGDRYGIAWDHYGEYIPIPDYADAVQNTYTRLGPAFASGEEPPQNTVYVASDSPTAQQELAELLPESTQWFALGRSENDELRSLASPNEYVQAEFDKLDVEQRVKLTRGMLVDFAMLSGMWAWPHEVTPLATVCTISSSVCRMAAVGLGWERAFGNVTELGEIIEDEKGWVEIDRRDLVTPAWQAFELFM